MKIAIIGGGAAGFFAALSASEAAKQQKIKVDITIYESSSQFLKKVKISGGGRCNVTHHQYDIKQFVQNYPRGSKELVSAFHQFQAEDTVKWFKQRGVNLVAEADGRMFPDSNLSQTIIDCFVEEAQKNNVALQLNKTVTDVKIIESKFKLSFKSGESLEFDRVMLATGSSPAGYKISQALGHSITERAPSLFTFKIKHPVLEGLMGTSFEKVQLKLKVSEKKVFQQAGPMLITHWGLSGPAVLKLSAWAAREMKSANYKAKLIVNFTPFEKIDELKKHFNDLKASQSNAQVQNIKLYFLTKRFWNNFLQSLKIPSDKKVGELSKKHFNQIMQNLFECQLQISGQTRFKEEFVECGGVNLKEIDFKTFESKICPGLFIAGELLDVDGITGGFNFQNAWTGGHITGQNIIS